MSEISEAEIKSMTKEQNYMRGYEDGKKDVLDEIKAKIIDYHEIGCNLRCSECKMIACIEPKDVIADLEIIHEYRKEN